MSIESPIREPDGFLHPLAQDQELITRCANGVLAGVLDALQERVGFHLATTLGTRAYHRVLYHLADELKSLGWVAQDRGNQGRFLSDGDRYAEPYRLIPTRGWRYPGYIRVNRKKGLTLALVEQNARTLGIQPSLPEMPREREIQEDAARNVWLVYDFNSESLAIYLVLGSQLREDGRVLNWFELTAVGQKIRLTPEVPENLPEPVEQDFELRER